MEVWERRKQPPIPTKAPASIRALEKRHRNYAPTAERMNTLFFRHTDQPRTVSRAAALRLGVLFGPTVVVLTVLRLLEHSMLNVLGRPEIGDVVVGQGPILFFILLTTLVLGWGAFRAWPSIRPVWVIAGTMILGVGLLVSAAIFAPPWLTGWITPEAFQVLRWDLLILLGLGLVFALWLDHTGGWARALGLLALHALIPLMILLPIFEVSVIHAMGTPLDWAMLTYSIRHLAELAPVLSNEIGPAEVGLLLFPFVVTLSPLVITRLPRVRRWLDAAPPAAPRQSWRMAVAALPLAILLLVPPSVPLPPTHRTISYSGMMRSMLEDNAWSADVLAASDAPAALPFDAQNLRFVPTDETHRLNVVVILLESFRSRSVTPYNPALPTTPFFDDLARRSLLVDNMYAVVTYTNKSLAPILAGVYPELSLDVVESKPDAIPATGLPALLKPFGYRSAFFTPAILSFENKDVILNNLGFDESYGDAAFAKDGFHKANYFGYEDRVMLEPSMAWVDDVTASGEPFFLSYLTLTAHHDYQTPPTFDKQTFDAHEPEFNDYLNALRYTDDFLRDLFDAFDERGLIDSTLFILVGDHGEAFGEHGQITHGDVVWDEALHTPALVFNPTLFPEGGRITGNRSHIDVLPTVADALGYRIEGGAMPGVSLLQPTPDDRAVFHSTRDGNKTIVLRQDGLKFFYFNRRQPMQVYDLRNDPFERHDIAAEIDPDLLKAVELKLLLWRRGVQQIYHDPADPIGRSFSQTQQQNQRRPL